MVTIKLEETEVIKDGFVPAATKLTDDVGVVP